MCVCDVFAAGCCALFLEPDVSNRLGCLRGGARDVIEHAFLRGVDPEALLGRALPPAWAPAIEHDMDLSNFADIYDDDEEEESVPYDGDATWDF